MCQEKEDMMDSKMIKNLVFTAILASVYMVATVALAPISYGMVQFRLSEILVLLAFIDKKTIPGLVLGCVLANLYSQLGVIDVVFGSLATYLSVYLVSHTKNIIVASIWPSLINGVVIGILLNVTFGLPLWLSMASVAAGEFVVVTLIGVPIVKMFFLKNERLLDMLHLSYKGKM